ncbi:uncharacterized protein LOC135813783 [Sycon ciliatum]|uniref:uncharacterized protein LOC135813783 n=1 Tax=Sycon ciliatum TaxID=27933 RepID=UPI0031F64711
MLQTKRAQKTKKKACDYGKQAADDHRAKDPWEEESVKASVYDVSSPSSESSSSSVPSGSSCAGSSQFTSRTLSTTSTKRGCAASGKAGTAVGYGRQKVGGTYSKKKQPASTASTAAMRGRSSRTAQTSRSTSQTQKVKDTWMFGTAAEKENKALAVKSKTKQAQKSQKTDLEYSDFFEEKAPKKTASALASGSSTATRAKSDFRLTHRPSETIIPETPEAQFTTGGRGKRVLGDGRSQPMPSFVPDSPDFSICPDDFQATSTPFCGNAAASGRTLSRVPVANPTTGCSRNATAHFRPAMSTPVCEVSSAAGVRSSAPIPVFGLTPAGGHDSHSEHASSTLPSNDTSHGPASSTLPSDDTSNGPASSSHHSDAAVGSSEDDSSLMDTGVCNHGGTQQPVAAACQLHTTSSSGSSSSSSGGGVNTVSSGESTENTSVQSEDKASDVCDVSTPEPCRRRRPTRNTTRQDKAHRTSLALRCSRYFINAQPSASPMPTTIVIDDSTVEEVEHQLGDMSISDAATHQRSASEVFPIVCQEKSGVSTSMNGVSPALSTDPGSKARAAGKDHSRKTPVPLDPRVLARHMDANLIGDMTIADWVFPLTPAVQASPRDQLLAICGQIKPIPFSDIFTKSMLRQCRKVGEGVYGEVFVATNGHSEQVALKVIPIEGSHVVNGEPQKTFAEMIPEMLISTQLSGLGDTAGTSSCSNQNFTSNFIKLHRVACCQGAYPKSLLKLWDTWNRDHTSENDRPDFYPSGQLFIVFEFANGGRDLEHSEMSNFGQAISVFQQVTMALATAERAVEFEHRDLHWGNILLRECADDDIVTCRIQGDQHSVASAGFHISIIDFTLSRLIHDGTTVFCDLAADPTLFTGKGDFQFEVYRLMRTELGNDWSQTKPLTNVIWLRYLVDKLLHAVTYTQSQRSAAQRSSKARLTRLLQRLKSKTYDSAWSVLLNDEIFKC